MSGGRWNRAPVRVSNARDNCASDLILSWRRRTQTYSFPAPCWDFTRRVARSRQTIRHPYIITSKLLVEDPCVYRCILVWKEMRQQCFEVLTVTLGSKVPLWPVFSILSIRLIHATTSWLLGLLGLSRLITPLLMYVLRSRFNGVQPLFTQILVWVDTDE